MINTKTLINEYIDQSNWQVRENSNATLSVGAMGKHIITENSKDYWLRNVYPEHISRANIDGDLHIHDLGGMTLYCCGYSLEKILTMGVQGIENIPTSSPAKHFDSVLNQLANLTTVFQNEIMGAVAFNSVDTLLAPFIKQDNLSYVEVKQRLQNFIFSINSNFRCGSEPAFSNVTLDLTPPEDLIDNPAIVGGAPQNFTYRECQKEMDMFNRAFYEIMLEGDSRGKLFSYPIPTYNIHERFDWDNPNNELLWEMSGKYGTPYFANFLNSDLDIRDIRSMCCRLSLDLTELKKKNGGLFGAGDSTGSVGVVTINMPRIGYLAKNKDEFFSILDKQLEIAKESLEIKREWLDKNILKKGLIPAFQTYVGTLDNHFSTIGVVGLNEMCHNFICAGINTPNGKEFALAVGEYIQAKLLKFQEETGHLYNYEATPAESTCYRLAKKDRKKFADCYTQGEGENIYYTNSCHLPVKEVASISENFKHQDDLQVQFTGGTVIHSYLEGAISGEQAKSLVKSLCQGFRVPYISLSPISRYCDSHGYVAEVSEKCPLCGSKVKMYQRITGYLRCVDNFNIGKKQEFADRKQITEC